MAWIKACGVGLAFAISLAVATASAQDYVWGTSCAELSGDPGYEGLWKYCLEIAWDVRGYDGYGLSHLDVFLGLEDCPCVCAEGYFDFADTAGVGSGTANGDSCLIRWHGMFSCDGDPTIPDGVPLIKFEYYEDDCEPNKVGWVHVCFYSVAAPSPMETFPDALGIKFGPYFEKGDLVGVLPTCEWDYSSSESDTWGMIKALYR